MNNWNHKHLIDLSSLSFEDYQLIITLSRYFKGLPSSIRSHQLSSLTGKVISTLFFESSTRTRNSFEIAAKKLSAYVQTFSPATSSLIKGETDLDTALAFSAMGSDILIIRHKDRGIPNEIAKKIDKTSYKTSVLNAGDGFHNHPSQALIDLFTLIHFFAPTNPNPKVMANKKIAIIGDILHSRVARSNLISLSSCGANIILCGPKSLLPESFKDFLKSSFIGKYKNHEIHPGEISITRSINEALEEADAVITLRLQKERMNNKLVNTLDGYQKHYQLSHDSFKDHKKIIPILHPGPVNRDVEITSKLLEDQNLCLVQKQIENSTPVRMALLYLLANSENNQSI